MLRLWSGNYVASNPYNARQKGRGNEIAVAEYGGKVHTGKSLMDGVTKIAAKIPHAGFKNGVFASLVSGRLFLFTILE